VSADPAHGGRDGGVIRLAVSCGARLVRTPIPCLSVYLKPMRGVDARAVPAPVDEAASGCERSVCLLPCDAVREDRATVPVDHAVSSDVTRASPQDARTRLRHARRHGASSFLVPLHGFPQWEQKRHAVLNHGYSAVGTGMNEYQCASAPQQDERIADRFFFFTRGVMASPPAGAWASAFSRLLRFSLGPVSRIRG